MNIGPGVVLGRRLGPFAGTLLTDLIRRYAAATRDPNPRVRAGTAVPPVALVTQIWDAQQAAFSTLIPEPVRASMTGGVHGEHDIVVHRPVRPGEELRTWVAGHGARRVRDNLLVTLRYETCDDGDELVAQQWWTTVLFGADGAAVGDAAPDHVLADAGGGLADAGEGLADAGEGTSSYEIVADADMPRRYAEVSGDWSPHHFEVDAARQSGFERPFLHGLCTMALCAQGLVALAADGDPDRVRRVAVRFSAPTFVGDELVVRANQVDDRRVAFDAIAGGATTIRHGLFELRG